MNEINYEAAYLHCSKYLSFLESIFSNKELSEQCRDSNKLSIIKNEDGISIGDLVSSIDKELESKIYDIAKDFYHSDISVSDYRTILERRESFLNETNYDNYSLLEILSIITYLYRMEHFNNGSLINTAIGEGYLYKFYKIFINKYEVTNNIN